MTDVSIVFVNYRSKDLTINAIKSVFEKTEGIEYEIFVVDNNSQDGSIEAIKQKFSNINIIKNPVNAGFGSANNIAIKHTKGKYILCLNTDTLLINNAVKIMFDFMEKEDNKNVGVCGAYLTNLEGKPCSCGGNFPNLVEVFCKLGLKPVFNKYLRTKYGSGLKSNEVVSLKHIDYISGADIFFRKSVLDEVGLFDENIFMYFEETDLCKRIKQAKYDIKVVKEAEITHFDGGSTKAGINKKKMFRTSEFYYFRKHLPHYIYIIKIIYMILYSIDWLILGHKDGKELLLFIIKNFLKK